MQLPDLLVAVAQFREYCIGVLTNIRDCIHSGFETVWHTRRFHCLDLADRRIDLCPTFARGKLRMVPHVLHVIH